MAIFVFCPYCHKQTHMNILKTDNIKKEGGKIEDLHYLKCDHCEKVWIEHDEYTIFDTDELQTCISTETE